MDPRPEATQSAVTRVAGLEPVERRLAFPIPATPPFVGAALGDHLHIVALDEAGQQAQHLALDRDGRPAGEVARLPLLYVEGMIACAEGLALVGTGSSDGEPVILGLDAEGRLLWRSEIPIGELVMVSPQPVCSHDRVGLVWATGRERSTLWTTTVQGGACGQPISLELDDPTYELRAIPAGRGLTLARIHGDDLRLELMRIVEGRDIRRAAVAHATQPVSPDIVALEDQYAVLWIAKAERELRMQWFDWDLRPTGSPEKLASTVGPTQLHSARFIQGGPGYLAISYQTVAVGDGWVVIGDESGAPRHREPRRTYEQFVAGYDWLSHIPGRVQQVVEPEIFYEASGWLGNVLLLIHGERDPMISIYRAQ